MADTPAIIPQSESYLPKPHNIDELFTFRDFISKSIVKQLIPEIDYGSIPGTGGKPVLLKPGAEKVCGSFRIIPEYEIIEKEINHDYIHNYKDKYNKVVTAVGLYRFVIKCTFRDMQTGNVVGQGLGSASSLESKWRSRPTDIENTILKMAKKRSLVDTTLSTFCLSEQFTQDFGDNEEDYPIKVEQNHPSNNKNAAKPQQVKPQQESKIFDPNNAEQIEAVQLWLHKNQIEEIIWKDIIDRLAGKPGSQLKEVALTAQAEWEEIQFANNSKASDKPDQVEPPTSDFLDQIF